MPTLLPHGPLNPVSYDRCGTVSGRCIDISRTSEPVMSIINSNLVLSSNVGLAKYCQDGHLHGSNLVRVSPAKYLQTGDWKVPQGFQSFTLTISFLALALTRSFIPLSPAVELGPAILAWIPRNRRRVLLHQPRLFPEHKPFW